MFVYNVHFRFVVIGGNLTAQLPGNHRGIGDEIQIPEIRRSCELSFLFPPCHQSAPELVRRLIVLYREHEVSAASKVIYVNSCW